ncbi:glycine dehydrogenase [Dacryopinax primogenitus]|uniref:Glycine cleavage system H protein n=1 Tax=Dacryopinax primogenitus (strain DJM 731) TaxID=1858805 RepID=M5G2C0_DACPD|nr:glycine dehydrogenase [Dacryopinax primogenitus]EJT97912.1 glycine dehydrogenase [Dacryopinax primogenitus]
MSLFRASFVARRVLRAPRAFPARSWAVRTLTTKKYTTAHEWIIYDDATSTGTTGITDYAQSSLGDVVFVELPAPGSELLAGEPLGAVESVKAASDIYSPVSGTVEEVNEILASEPGLLNKSPEERGWLARIKMSNPAEMDELLTEEAYKAHCENEEH